MPLLGLRVIGMSEIFCDNVRVPAVCYAEVSKLHSLDYGLFNVDAEFLETYTAKGKMVLFENTFSLP